MKCKEFWGQWLANLFRRLCGRNLCKSIKAKCQQLLESVKFVVGNNRKVHF